MTGPMWLSCARRQVFCRELWSTTLTCMTSNGPWFTPTCSTQRLGLQSAWGFGPDATVSFIWIHFSFLKLSDNWWLSVTYLVHVWSWCLMVGNMFCSCCSGWWTSLALCLWRTLWSVWEPCYLPTSGRTSRSASRWPPSITSSSPPSPSQSFLSPSRALRVTMLKSVSVHHNWYVLKLGQDNIHMCIFCYIWILLFIF